MKELQYHEAANIFPMMTGADFDGLVEDIKKHGQLHSIVLLDGLILDGRNRYLACLKVGVKPRFENVKTDDPIAYVLSANDHRRHLSVPDRAFAAQRARAWYDEQAKKRMREGGKTAGRGRPEKGANDCTHPIRSRSRDAAGVQFGVSGVDVDAARHVIESGVPELEQAVREKKIGIRPAAQVAQLPKEEQEAIVSAADPHKAWKERETTIINGDNTPSHANSKSVALARGNEAIDALKQIPANDPLRNRGFQIVTDWIKANKKGVVLCNPRK